MSSAVVVVGPATVLGPGAVDAELAAVALDGIDDELVLVDERVVPVDRVWSDVVEAALPDPCDGVVLVCPSWWPRSRLARVEAAGRAHCGSVTVRHRAEVLAAAVVVEIAPELVLVHAAGRRHAVARVGGYAEVVAAVLARVRESDSVTVDTGGGIGAFDARLVRALRQAGVVASIVDDRSIARAMRADVGDARPTTRRRAITPRAAVLAGAVLSVVALGAAAVGLGGAATDTETEVTWLVEGRVAVEVPWRWAVQRITSGPGSARVRVVSPSQPMAALHVTQSQVPDAQTLDVTAEQLRRALAEEPDGVFVNFTPAGRRAERPAVTYSEIRADHHVAWAVLLDGGVRIAIGCQGAPGGPGPEWFCDRAVRSAHAVS